jgi:hypothetical protein
MRPSKQGSTPKIWNEIKDYLSVSLPINARAFVHRMKSDTVGLVLPSSFVEEWTSRPRGKWSSVANRALAQAVRSFAASRSYLALSDRYFLISLALLIKREAEARSPAERSLARSHLEHALRGFHPPSLLTRGRPKHVSGAALAMEADLVYEQLQSCAKHQNSQRARLDQIQRWFPWLTLQESLEVSGLLQRSRKQKRLRLTDAKVLVLASRYKKSKPLLKKELHRSRCHVEYAQSQRIRAEDKTMQPNGISAEQSDILDSASEELLKALAKLCLFESDDAE